MYLLTSLYQLIDSNNDGTITIEEFADWIARDETALQSLGELALDFTQMVR